jgi:hypothetical protein
LIGGDEIFWSDVAFLDRATHCAEVRVGRSPEELAQESMS